MINVILSSTLLTWDESQGRREIGPFVHEETKKRRIKTHGKQATAWAPFFDLRLLFNDNNNEVCSVHYHHHHRHNTQNSSQSMYMALT